MSEPTPNTPEFSVSDLAGALKRTIEDQFGHVRLRGEISGYRGPHSSGHVYFSLKDEGARIDAVIWKGVFSRLKFKPEEGLEVVATGRISTFPGKSSYQIIIEAMEPAGVGALMALLEERRRKLQAEGLFDQARKRPLPYLPRVIGIVTSPTGAVIRDVIHRIADRFPREILLWPARVQGEGSAEEVAAGIRGLAALDGTIPGLPRPDVIIVARGGGSLEDLWSFNEEVVIRAASQCPIPLVSAIGHETDWTLLDLVADIRAPTPTAAAEMVVPVRAELLADLRSKAARLTGGMARMQERRRRDLAGLVRALPTGETLLDIPRQRLDRATLRRSAAMRGRLDKGALALSALARKLAAQRPEARLARQRERLNGLAQRLHAALPRRLETQGQRLTHLTHRLGRAMAGRIQFEGQDIRRRRQGLEALARRLAPAVKTHLAREQQRLATFVSLMASLDHRKVLQRGFALVRDEGGHLIRASKGLEAGQAVRLEFSDGAADAHIDGEATASSRPKAPPRGAKPGGSQGSLF